MHCVNYTRTCGSVSYLNPTSTKRTGKGHGRSGLSIDRGALKLLKGRVHDAGSFSIVRRKGSSFGIKAQEDEDAAERASFGYNRKDVILIGVALVAAGAGMYYGLQKIFGINALVAGNVVQIVFVLLLSLGWLSTYLFRVATKNMTYTQQLKDYEEAVMEKRLEEMSDEEINKLTEENK